MLVVWLLLFFLFLLNISRLGLNYVWLLLGLLLPATAVVFHGWQVGFQRLQLRHHENIVVGDVISSGLCTVSALSSCLEASCK